MSLKVTRKWYQFRKRTMWLLFIVAFVGYSILYGEEEFINWNKIYYREIEKNLEEALIYDKGMGCEIPQLDPFAPEILKFVQKLPKIVCEGQDWVKCYLSTCKVVPEVLRHLKDIVCYYSYILFKTDSSQKLDLNKTAIRGDNPFYLKKSDHVLIDCRGREPNSSLTFSWSGYGTGLRPVTTNPAPLGREHTYNILLFAFDSTSKNGFIRKMPKSYKFLKEQVKPVILNRYNIVGSGTIRAMTPILTGSTHLELPEVRKNRKNYVDIFPFIFYKLKEDGYRTAYLEDTPHGGTYQYCFNGFKNQPTDHYFRPLMMDKYQYHDRHTASYNEWKHCLGDTPSYKVMMNVTEQFMSLPGKKFILNFIADISHDEFNKIQTADEDLVLFLQNFMQSGLKENTLLVVMGDHGQRFGGIRETLQGKLEERLPLMAIRLPDSLVAHRADALSSLIHNAEVLTTPHDLHATLLDVVDLRESWNPYRIKGADLPRSMTMLDPIPASRSCSEAGVEANWCACLSWKNVSSSDPLYIQAAYTLIDFINKQTETLRSKCAYRTLSSIEWVITHKVNAEIANTVAANRNSITGRFNQTTHIPETVQIKLKATPAVAVYEASLTYINATKQLTVNPGDVSRVNAYGHEPDCISATHPHLNQYCYCNDYSV